MSQPLLLKKPKDFFQKFIISCSGELPAILFIIVMILFGYHEIFLGANFFTFKDPIGMSDFTYYTPFNGWRPDIRLGISFFFGDPGMSHPWSLFSLWEKIAPSREFAYNFVIILFGICSAISLYFFLRKIAPELGRSVAIFCPLVVFCQEQLNSQYARGRCSVSTGVPLLLMLLYHFYQRPRMLHFLLMGLLFWFVAFFGTILNLTQMMMVGFLFTILYTIYFKENIKKMAMKFLSAYSVAGFLMIFLGMWIFYSFFWEYLFVGYMREKAFYFPLKFDLLPNLRNLFHFFMGLFQVEWLPTNLELPGMSWRPVPHFFNVVVIMPLILFFFIFRRSSSGNFGGNFWEFALKWLVVISIGTWALEAFFPVYASLQAYISHKSSSIVSLPVMERTFFPLQIGLLTLFFSKMKSGNFSLKNVCVRRIYGTVACVLSACYAGLLLFAIFAILLPDFFPTAVVYLTDKFIPQKMGEYPKEFGLSVLLFIVEHLQSAMNWRAILFYLSSIVLIVLFAKNRWPVFDKTRVFIPGLLLLNGIMFSWTVYPLNYKKFHFEEHAERLPSFHPTDRFYHARVDYSDLPAAKTIRQFKDSWIDIEGQGKREYILGEEETPGLNLSSSYNFSPNHVSSFIYHIFNDDKIQRLPHIRNLVAGPVLSSELLDMSAVNYYYSLNEMPNPPPNLSLTYRGKQLYIYKNNSAWPYFYLARNLEIISGEKNEIQNVKQGTAYIEKKDSFALSQNAGGGIIKMKEFLFGKMIFDFQSRQQELLVIADSWHPLWRAKANHHDLSIIRANDIFKGIILPAGKYDVTVFFDNSPYLIGIYLSIIAWTLFFVCFIFAIKFNREVVRPQL